MTRPTRMALRLLLLLPLAASLGGCGGALIGVEAASVAVFGRDVVDIGVSAITGKDCSLVRLDRQQTYCAARDRLPGPAPYCTRTLGMPQCWANPEAFATLPRQLADTPAATADQARQAATGWLGVLNVAD